MPIIYGKWYYKYILKDLSTAQKALKVHTYRMPLYTQFLLDSNYVLLLWFMISRVHNMYVYHFLQEL